MILTILAFTGCLLNLILSKYLDEDYHGWVCACLGWFVVLLKELAENGII